MTFNQDTFNEISAVISRQINTQENLTEQLGKANALIQGALQVDFLDLPKSELHNYLWALADLIAEANQMSEQVLDALLTDVPRATHSLDSLVE
jgi:hypothetical protein